MGDSQGRSESADRKNDLSNCVSTCTGGYRTCELRLENCGPYPKPMQHLDFDAAHKLPMIEEILSRVLDGATWQNLAPDVRSDLEKRAIVVLAQDRQDWGLTGLRQKETVLLSVPTPAMTENVDRILSTIFASVTPNGFKMARDISNADLKRNLLRIYLATTDERGFMLSDHPDFMGWDGLPVKKLMILDHEHVATMAYWLRETEDDLRALPDPSLTTLEMALRDKAYFTTRSGKHFDRPAVAVHGLIGYSALYAKPVAERPFANDAELLDAYNASMFAKFREVNVGTLDAFVFDYESEYNAQWLKSQGMSDDLVQNVLKLGLLYFTRTQDLPEKNKRCHIFSPPQRASIWDAFTAEQRSNADGVETMESYAKLFEAVATQRLSTTREIGRMTLERTFPDGSKELTPEQKAQVVDKLMLESQPARMLESLISLLDQVTGGTAASDKVRAATDAQTTVGGNYSEGQPVRDADRVLIEDMWDKLRAFIKREYSGYRVDIPSLIPDKPIIVSTGQSQFTVGGQVNLSLGRAWNLASFSSTMMHEITHAIDQKSHAPVEGAAWEGAATTVERQVWPIFIDEAMAGQAELLPLARLQTEIDNVRVTATTDATLKIFMRESCRDDEPDSIAYAENVVASYGYSDPEVLRLRSRRAHSSWQYLMYDYGHAMYADLIAYLQNEIGPSHRVDAFLLQACGMHSPKKDRATANDLRACIRERKT